MKNYAMRLLCLILLFTAACVMIFADSNPNPYSTIINSEFSNTPLVYAPLSSWEVAGCNAVIDTVFTINVEAIPESVTYYSTTDSTYYHIPNAVSDDEADDFFTFNKLIIWMKDNIANQGIHAQIYIPSGVYNFNDQLVLHSNISLKGDGSNLTVLRFLIDADTLSTIMNQTDCRKDAILISGTSELPQYRIYNVGIENLKIVRIREGLTPEEVKYFVGDHQTINGIQGYYGNNIAIRYGQDCWVKGVESENTFRNHVTLEFSYHITVSGVYFHHANNYGAGGYGYGVGIWDSSNNRIENSIFEHLRHGVTIVDKSWFNVIAYNYSREQHSYVDVLGVCVGTEWSDIAIHGESHNTWQSEDNPEVLGDNNGLVKQAQYRLTSYLKAER